MEINGKYGSAIVYTDEIEQEAISQIINLLGQPMAQDAHVRIMPDCHAGAGCVIGYTAKLTDKIVPNLIGVDIGCGVASWKLGKRSLIGENFDKLDKVIRDNIPSGREVRSEIDKNLLNRLYKTLDIKDLSFNEWLDKVREICKRMGQDTDRVLAGIGSLGGGNHFIEVDKDDNDELWLTLHSGSRNFGLKIALFHQEQAEIQTLCMPKEIFDARVKEIKATKKGKSIETAIEKLRAESKVRRHKRDGLEYLEGSLADQYYQDMHIAQIYAQLNRRVMAFLILKKMYKIDFFNPIESIHNYINFDDKIVRKGSISAHDGEKIIIPLNMADGIIIGTGKGNAEWNYSAPHGAGRKMSRSKAKVSIRLEDFKKRMQKAGVWSSCITKDTLDESPQAYKDADKIISYLSDSVDVEVRMFPVYNFKASE